MKKILILLAILNCIKISAAQYTAYNSTDYNISDNCTKINSTIVVSGIDIYFEINHPKHSDLTIWLTAYYNGSWHDYILYNQGSLTSTGLLKISKTNLSLWNGVSPNQTWYLGVKDCVSGNTGYIGFFQIWLNYVTCTLTVSPEALSFPASGGSKQITVTSNGSWTVSDNSTWITVSPSSGKGNGTVTVNVANYTGNTQRVGTVTITGCNTTKSVMIIQDPCSLTVSPEALSFAASGGSKQITVTSSSSWTVSDNSTWITVSPSSGTGNGTVTVNVANYTGNTQRVGTVTITGCNTTKSVMIIQNPCNLTIAPKELLFGGSGGTKEITVTSNGSWTVSDNSTWITVSPSSGTGNGIVTVNVTGNNESLERSGNVTITGCNTTETVTIKDIPSSIISNTFDPVLYVYPNPADDEIIIELIDYIAPYQIEIYSSSGVLITKKESNLQVETINLSSFTKGIYYLKIYNNEYAVTKKIVLN